MATTRKQANDKFKMETLEAVSEFLTARGETVLRTKSGEISFPFVNENGEEEFLKLTFVVPNGSRDKEPYDGFGEAESYAMKLKADEEKAKAAAEAKAKKIARDEKYRAKKAEQQAAREAEGGE